MINNHKKIIAWNLLTIFTLSNIVPLNLLAVSGGPSQPEVETFQPVGVSGLVNKYSGDFSYNLPLMSVPGPNGSYPINLIYSAGPTMYQEASWVGLGWNINPGSIKRHLNGVPDEFNGDKIIHFNYEKKQKRTTKTLGASVNAAANIPFGDNNDYGAGASVEASGSYTWVNDSYKGDGFISGSSLRASIHAKLKQVKPGLSLNNSVSLSSFDGVTSSFGISANVSLASGKFAGAGLSTGINWTYNSKSGYRGTSFRSSSVFEYSVLNKDGKEALKKIEELNAEIPDDLTPIKLKEQKEILLKNTISNEVTLGSSFTNNDNVTSPVRTSGMARTGQSSTWGVEIGVKFNFSDIINLGTDVSYTKTESESEPVSPLLQLSSYGYLNLGNGGNGAMDYATHNQTPLSITTPQIAYPKYAQDGFVATGQGLAGFFQAKRKDIGLLHQNKSVGTIDHKSYEIDLAYGVGVGSDSESSGLIVSYNQYENSYTKTSIGKWDYGLLSDFDSEFKQTLSADDYYEAYSFLSTGELTQRDQFDIDDIFYNDDVLLFDVARDNYSGSFENENLYRLTNDVPTFNIKKGRTQRNQYFEPITFEEYNDIRSAYGTNKVSHIYNRNEHPDELPVVNENLNDYLTGVIDNYSHHFKEIQVYNVNGELYEYGIPAYNNYSKEITFSSADLAEGSKVRGEISPSGVQGYEESYRGSQINNFAHSFLITAIYSPDYVDVTNNGPTEDDFGFWVKFNYSKIDNFDWGTPSLGVANYMPGYINNSNDQYGSFQSGRKKLYYVNSIETKTHIAKFKTSNRADASSTDATKTLQKLDRIELYNKRDEIPLKTIHFNYDYSLCSGILNFQAVNQTINEPGNGKLTLKGFYTTYKNNLKGRLTPYTFDYAYNPDFKFGNFDSWGVYKNETTSGPYIDQVPFPEQMNNTTQKTKRDLYASSWSLSTITLPSKGTIEVDYEMDDYLWVQDKKSMQMHEVIGMAPITVTSELGVETSGDISNKYRIFFKLHLDDYTQVDDDYMASLVEDIEMLYFRTWMKYKDDEKYDYAKGYAPIGNDFGTIDYQGEKIGYIDIKPTEVFSTYWKDGKVTYNNPIEIHPFQAEVLKQIQHYRSDLEYDKDEYQKKKELRKELKHGFEKMALDEKWGEGFEVNNNKYPSYIRLNTANKAKFGGGHRVKSIKITDNANALGLEESSYGKTYYYKDKHGNTSGVTGAEPFASREESPFKQPIFYSSVYDYDKPNFNDKELYTDYCMGSPFFPSSSVGYSRILEESTSYDNSGNPVDLDPRVADGIIEEEYYTSKDFPVIYKSKLGVPNKNHDRPSWAPPIVSYYKRHDSYVVSQGLTVEVNDMAGKLKSTSKYPYYQDVLDPGFNMLSPVYRETHRYKQNGNKLTSKVNIDGSQKDLGLDIQTAIAVDQNKTFSTIADVDVSFKFIGFIPFLLSAQYTNTQELNNAQSISTTKVIARNGILSSKEVYMEGKRMVKNNLAYSPITGEVTEVGFLDEFNTINKIKKETTSEHYALARGKYLYDNIHFSSGTITSVVVGTPPVTVDQIHVALTGRIGSYLKEGDKLLIKEQGSNTNYIAYVSNVTSLGNNLNTWFGIIDIIEYSGASLNGVSYSDIKVIDPANTNQLTLNAYVKTMRGNDVLSAQATTYKDSWLDNGFEKKEIENYELSEFPEVPYTNGQKGILRPEQSFTFNNDRVYSLNSNNKGGYANFTNDFNFDDISLNTDWISPLKTSQYSPYGYGIEAEDLRGIKSASFYDYSKSLVTISAQNAGYKEIAFDAFEDYELGERNKDINHGHLVWNIDDLLLDPIQQIYQSLNAMITDEDKHTGKASLKFVLNKTSSGAQFFCAANSLSDPYVSASWEFENNKRYVVQFWEKSNITGGQFIFGALGASSFTASPEIKVGDWVRKEYVFDVPTNNNISLSFQKDPSAEGVAYIDDFRVTPYNSSSKAFVYDAQTYNVKAILDQNNFAALYQYDEQGNLVISKKETLEGIKSISSNRSNIKQ